MRSNAPFAGGHPCPHCNAWLPLKMIAFPCTTTCPLQAGVLVGSVGAGAELADGSYISDVHGRTTGITDAGAEAAPWQP